VTDGGDQEVDPGKDEVVGIDRQDIVAAHEVDHDAILIITCCFNSS